MTEHIRKLLERLPDYHATIQDLSGRNTAFDNLCHKYNNVSERLDSVGGAEAETSDQMETLKRRRRALEDELIALMETNIRP